MHYGLYVSAAGALANLYRQDVAANNLANADTVSFKRDLALLRGRPTEAQQTVQRRHTDSLLEGIGGGCSALPTATDFSPAGIKGTGRDLDVALDGSGFFQVQGPDGQACYTRDGRFVLDEQNHLVTSAGRRSVLDTKGKPITLNPDEQCVISETGAIEQGGRQVARLGIVDFDDPQVLRKTGDNFYVTDTAASPRPVRAHVKQKALENSAVNPIKELTGMIRAQRLFDLNMSMLKVQDQTLGMATTRLASLG